MSYPLDELDELESIIEQHEHADIELRKIQLASQGKTASQGGMNTEEIKELLKSKNLRLEGFYPRRSELERILKLYLDGHLTNEHLTVAEKIAHTKPAYLDSSLLDHMAMIVENSSTESGGLLDLHHSGKLDKAVFRIGGQGYVNLEGMDYELNYHVHPRRQTLGQYIRPDHIVYDLPSPADVAAVVYQAYRHGDNSQAHIIFAQDAVYVLQYDFSKKWRRDQLDNKKPIYAATKVFNDMNTAYNVYQNIQHFIEKMYAATGVYIHRYTRVKGESKVNVNVRKNWPDKVPVYITILEPFHKPLAFSR